MTELIQFYEEKEHMELKQGNVQLGEEKSIRKLKVPVKTKKG